MTVKLRRRKKKSSNDPWAIELSENCYLFRVSHCMIFAIFDREAPRPCLIQMARMHSETQSLCFIIFGLPLIFQPWYFPFVYDAQKGE